MKATFLFGAGASVEFGVPTMARFTNEFWPFLRESEGTEEFTTEIERLLRSLVSHGTGDLEELLSGLQTLTSSGPVWADALAAAGRLGRDDVDGLNRTAYDALTLLTYYIVQRCEKLDWERAAEHFRPLLEAVTREGTPTTLFTTNYDRALEHTADAMGVPYSDGFIWSKDESLLVWKKEYEHPLRIVKLHGSVTWYGEEGSETVFRMRDAYAFPYRGFYVARDGAGGVQQRLSPFMIIPTMEKEALRPPYIDYQLLFHDELKACGLLVVVGNSLRDGHLRKVVEDRLDDLLVLTVGPDASRSVPFERHRDRVVPLDVKTTEFCRHGASALGDLIRGGDLDAAALQEFARTVAKAVDLEREEEDPRIKGWVKALRTGDIAGRSEAALELGRIESASATLPLIEALSHPSEDVRMAATAALAWRGDSEAVPVLGRHVVEKGRSQRERIEAALALAAIGGEEAERALSTASASPRADVVLKRVVSHASTIQGHLLR